MNLTLDRGALGSSYAVQSFQGLPEATVRRLESLGMTPGVVVEVLNNKSHGTVIVRLRESRWALGRTISSHIHVTPSAPAGPMVSAPRFSVGESSCAIGVLAPQGTAAPDGASLQARQERPSAGGGQSGEGR